jgi:hypothetical protein
MELGKPVLIYSITVSISLRVEHKNLQNTIG